MMIFRNAYTARYKSYTVHISKTPDRYCARCDHDFLGQEHIYGDTLREVIEKLKRLAK